MANDRDLGPPPLVGGGGFWDSVADVGPQAAEAPAVDDDFDEAGYLEANPDVAVAVSTGAVASGKQHYRYQGRMEGRPLSLETRDPRDRFIDTDISSHSAIAQSPLRYSPEAVIVSRSGGVMILGWIDDDTRPLDSICLAAPGWRIIFDGAGLARRARPDVCEALGRQTPYSFGYLGFVFGARDIRSVGKCEVTFRFRDGAVAIAMLDPRLVDDIELRLILLSHLLDAPHLGGETTNAIACLERGMGQQIIDFNQCITQPIVKNPYVERFAGPSRRYRGSIVVCLYGRLEYHFVQNALFSTNESIGDYEFIYVSNSPELTDPLLANAKKAHRLHGLDQTMVLLPGNAGFGAANNVAVNYAQSERILVVNPDVFPKDPAWARKHQEVLDTRPKAETEIFGAPLYYDDGSLMHGGMFFEIDTRVSFDRNRTLLSHLVRVEHYGKGAPPDSAEFTRPRPVPSVTGAFISAARPWFEKLGGFTEDYVFGHYEDADLCLKSLARGVAPWLHDLRLWHLEGKGSTRLPVHEGGSVVNRWLFSSQWAETINDGLLGPSPTHPLLNGQLAAGKVQRTGASAGRAKAGRRDPA